VVRNCLYFRAVTLADNHSSFTNDQPTRSSGPPPVLAHHPPRLQHPYRSTRATRRSSLDTPLHCALAPHVHSRSKSASPRLLRDSRGRPRAPKCPNALALALTGQQLVRARNVRTRAALSTPSRLRRRCSASSRRARPSARQAASRLLAHPATELVPACGGHTAASSDHPRYSSSGANAGRSTSTPRMPAGGPLCSPSHPRVRHPRSSAFHLPAVTHPHDGHGRPGLRARSAPSCGARSWAQAQRPATRTRAPRTRRQRFYALRTPARFQASPAHLRCSSTPTLELAVSDSCERARSSVQLALRRGLGPRPQSVPARSPLSRAGEH
jgi:hypothetical protein